MEWRVARMKGLQEKWGGHKSVEGGCVWFCGFVYGDKEERRGSVIESPQNR